MIHCIVINCKIEYATYGKQMRLADSFKQHRKLSTRIRVSLMRRRHRQWWRLSGIPSLSLLNTIARITTRFHLFFAEQLYSVAVAFNSVLDVNAVWWIIWISNSTLYQAFKRSARRPWRYFCQHLYKLLFQLGCMSPVMSTLLLTIASSLLCFPN